MSDNGNPDLKYERPEGFGWWLLWMAALLVNLVVVALSAFSLLGLSVVILPQPSDWDALIVLIGVLLVFTSSALVLLLMGADEGKTAHWLHTSALMTNGVLAASIMVIGISFGAMSLLILLLHPGLNLLLIQSNRRLVRKGLCPSCLYNLTGNTSGLCPECGAIIRSPKPVHNGHPDGHTDARP